ncbi:MAG: hypothetical protein KF739_00775 [Cryobacterium sp.]|nr:hypothetical protein [Micrococcales bacterium]MBX3308951.1 hypothetical protein [Cryobacterium sp.]
MNSKSDTANPPYDPAKAWRVHRRLVRAGQALMLAGAVVAIIHWFAHLEFFTPGQQPPGWLDLVAGYPTGGMLLILGAVLAGRRKPSSKRTQ